MEELEKRVATLEAQNKAHLAAIISMAALISDLVPELAEVFRQQAAVADNDENIADFEKDIYTNLLLTMAAVVDQGQR